MKAKDFQIESLQQDAEQEVQQEVPCSQESPWLVLAQRIVRAHVAQRAVNKEDRSCPNSAPTANISNIKN
jgi:hypothetical protein